MKSEKGNKNYQLRLLRTDSTAATNMISYKTLQRYDQDISEHLKMQQLMTEKF